MFWANRHKQLVNGKFPRQKIGLNFWRFLPTGIGYGCSTLRTNSQERASNFESLKFILKVPFSWRRHIFLVVEFHFTLCACHYISSVFKLLCTFFKMFIICKTFTVTDDVQRKNNVYPFQLKSFEHNNMILFQVFLKRSKRLISGRGSS